MIWGYPYDLGNLDLDSQCLIARRATTFHLTGTATNMGM